MSGVPEDVLALAEQWRERWSEAGGEQNVATIIACAILADRAARSGEPVAWRVRPWRRPTNGWRLTYCPDRYSHTTYEHAPLFAAPPEAAQAEREACLKAMNEHVDKQYRECNHLLPMDCSTGVRECDLEHTVGCFCWEREEMRDVVAAAIRARVPQAEGGEA